jgi:L-alanine-DL-glutamate epimerase-like enolase superfamily enzyme
MIPDLLLILALRMHDNFGKHLGQNVFKQLGGELEAGPAMTVFQDIQDVTWRG